MSPSWSGILERLDGREDVPLGELVLGALEADLVEPAELGPEDALQEDVRPPSAPLGVRLGRGEVAIPEVLQEQERRDLGDIVLEERREVVTHGATFTRTSPVRSFRISPFFCVLRAVSCLVRSVISESR